MTNIILDRIGAGLTFGISLELSSALTSIFCLAVMWTGQGLHRGRAWRGLMSTSARAWWQGVNAVAASAGAKKGRLQRCRATELCNGMCRELSQTQYLYDGTESA